MKKIFYILVLFNLILLSCYAQPSITWNKIYTPTPFFSDEAYCVSNTGSGFFYVGGHTYNSGYLMKIDNYGDSVWSLQPMVSIKTIITLPDRGCIIAGDSDSLTVLRLDSNGSIIWSKNFFQSLIIFEVLDLKKTLDNKYIACGQKNNQDGLVFKFDENGNLFWLKTFPAKCINSIEETSNGGFLSTGIGMYDAFLQRLDTAGNVGKTIPNIQ